MCPHSTNASIPSSASGAQFSRSWYVHLKSALWLSYACWAAELALNHVQEMTTGDECL